MPSNTCIESVILGREANCKQLRREHSRRRCRSRRKQHVRIRKRAGSIPDGGNHMNNPSELSSTSRHTRHRHHHPNANYLVDNNPNYRICNLMHCYTLAKWHVGRGARGNTRNDEQRSEWVICGFACGAEDPTEPALSV